jgi:DNA-binding NarL/FixJ family response regulator
MQMGWRSHVVRANFPQVKLIIISQHDPAALTAQAIDARVNDCLDKSRLGMDLVATIQALE